MRARPGQASSGGFIVPTGLCLEDILVFELRMNKPPVSVLLIALLYIAVGVIGFAAHFTELYAHGAYHSDAVFIELTELCALVCGAFMLRRQNWARWLAVAWIAFHVVLSAFEAFRGLAIHCLLLILIVWAVFHPKASRYFRHTSIGEAR